MEIKAIRTKEDLYIMIVNRFGNISKFCKKSGITHSTMYAVLRSQFNGSVRGDTVSTIADTLQVPFDQVANVLNYDRSRLKREIYKQGYSVHTLAEDIGIKEDTLHRICNKETKPQTKTITKIAKGLHKEFWEIERMCKQ